MSDIITLLYIVLCTFYFLLFTFYLVLIIRIALGESGVETYEEGRSPAKNQSFKRALI